MVACGGLETGPGEGPSAPLTCWELPPGSRLAWTCVRTQPAQPGSAPVAVPCPPPPPLPSLSGAGDGREGGEAIRQGLKRGKGREGARTRGGPYHVCVDLNRSHQAVDGLWRENKGGEEEKREGEVVSAEAEERREAPGRCGGLSARGVQETPEPQEPWPDSFMLLAVTCWARAFRGALPIQLPSAPGSPRCHHLPSDCGTGCSWHRVRLPGGLKPDLLRACTRG